MRGFGIGIGLTLCACALAAQATTVRPEDTGEALLNPGMGLVHYHYSNRLWAYGMYSKPGDKDPLPGTSVVYLRVLWNDVEPQEGAFRWDIFDSVAQNWIRGGKQIAFRIICCNQTENATPDWVRKAGAKGILFKYLKDDAEPRWEPVYDDPVFLEKYTNFLKAFAARYDGDPSVAFVDVGSFGLYGEGHTYTTSKLSQEETERLARIHIDLHRRMLPRTMLVIPDDFAGGSSTAPDHPLLKYARSLGIGYRDDSLLCSRAGWKHDHWGRLFAPTLPVILETGHYTLCDARGNWRKDRILEAVEKHQASYFTFHGFPEDFRESHAAEITAVNRRIGYRLMPVSVTFPDSVRAGEPVEIATEWVNKGVAPCLPGGFVSWSLCDAEGNVCWSFTDEDSNVRSLSPTLENGSQPVRRVSHGRFGCKAAIPPWNDAVLADLRKRGRVTETAFDMLRPGEYTLCVSVGTRQGTPKIALPLAAGAARRYPLGKVKVLPFSAASQSLAVIPIVVIPDEATAVEKFAASELAGELGKCLGATPEIVREGVCPQATRLYVGATKAAKALRAEPWQTDEVSLKSVANGVVLDGDPARAPIYAVDLYLEKYCGVRWWTSDAAFYPKLKEVPVKDIALEYAPQFKYRETYYLDGFDPLFKVRAKGNFTSLTRYMLSEMKFIPPEMGGNHRLYFFKGRHSAYHSFFEILPPNVYFEKHPEWYSLVKGKRAAKQLCLANQDMKAEYIKETLRRLREDSSVDFIQVSQNDWSGCCECEKCKAMMDEDGGAPSGPYLRFANDVAEAVEKDFPNVRIDTFAYQFTRRAPVKTRPRHNVVVRLCDIECDFARPLTDPLPPRKADFVKDLTDWTRVAGGNLFIWDYLANFHGYMLPHPNISVMAPNIRLFAANGAVGVFEQGDALCCAGSFAPLRHYVVSHLLWNPADDEKRLIDEFLCGYYGQSAAPILKKFIDVVDNAPLKTRTAVRCTHKDASFMSADDKLEAARLMDEAVAAAEKEGEAFASRVHRERLSVDHYMILNYDALKGIAAKKGYVWTRPDTRTEAVEKWIADVKAFGVMARRETTSAEEIDKYFESLRSGNGR